MWLGDNQEEHSPPEAGRVRGGTRTKTAGYAKETNDNARARTHTHTHTHTHTQSTVPTTETDTRVLAAGWKETLHARHII